MFIVNVNKLKYAIRRLHMKVSIWWSNRWKVRLYKKYPILFRQKNLPMSQSPMYWGIETGSGWKKLISDMCAEINNHYPNTEFRQIKEKFGILRVYYETKHTSDSVYSIIEKYETLSETTCEQCGRPGKITKNNGWISVKCYRCED